MKLNRSQRMQLKGFICLLGILLLMILLIYKVVLVVQRGEEGKDSSAESTESMNQEPVEPLLEIYANAWLMAMDEECVTVFLDGEARELVMEQTFAGSNEAQTARGAVTETVLADLTLTDGVVTGLKVKREKIRGKLLRASEEGIELEEYGIIPLAEDYRGYRAYGTPVSYSVNQLVYGYDFAEYIIENGVIVGFIAEQNEPMEDIRVLIKNSDFSSVFHDEVVLSCKSDFTVTGQKEGENTVVSVKAGKEFRITAKDPLLKDGRLRVFCARKDPLIFKNLSRNQKNPAYRGVLEIVKCEDRLVVINELLLEEYLYSVVPSEMPSSYPKEALKAQAVSARTFAYNAMLHAGYPRYGAHVDDSTSYQVYNNTNEKQSSTQAVKETFGTVLYTPANDLAEIFYYSTSCGVGSDENVWKTLTPGELEYMNAKSISRTGMQSQNPEFLADIRTDAGFADFIASVHEDDFEKDESWYRWNFTVTNMDPRLLHERLVTRQRLNFARVLVYDLILDRYIIGKIEEFQTVYDIRVAKRGPGGVCAEMIFDTDSGSYKVITEQNIRYVLNDGETKLVRKDGGEVLMPKLLPSAFFSIKVEKEKGSVIGYTLQGGGYGHGAGMSQNGARNMALSGYSCEDILNFFYEGCTLQRLY